MEFASEDLDRLITIETRPRFWRGKIKKLYEAARSKVGKPLTLAAAERLIEMVKPESTVIITSGFITPVWFPKGETDGPLGGIAILHAIQKGMNGKAVFISEEPFTGVLKAACMSGGIRTFGYDDMKKIPFSVAVQSFPVNEEEAKQEAKRLIEDLNPTAIIATEKCGRNEVGVYHTGYGYDISRTTAKVDYLFDEARKKGILTIGVGDLGNEIGMGSIRDTVRATIPNASKCKCPCGAGIATVTRADIPVVAAVCDWGLYGIAACISGLLEKPDALF
nr:DUF4392 domain-containing protein [Candidatus Bathyarchaeota archaeon]